MTRSSQDFTIYAGDDALPIVTVYDSLGAVLDLESVQQISWSVQRDISAAAVLTKTKTGGGITFVTDGTDGQFQIAIPAAASAALSGYYIHTATITDVDGNISTVTLGRVRVGQAPLWTYSGDPSNSSRDAVRSYIGDTDASDQQLYDAEIDYELTVYPQVLLASASCARKLAGKYSRKVSRRVGDLSINYSDIAKQYATMADDLEARGNTMGLVPYSGGTSISDMENVASNPDRPKPPFRRDQFDNPSGGNNTSNPGWRDC